MRLLGQYLYYPYLEFHFDILILHQSSRAHRTREDTITIINQSIQPLGLKSQPAVWNIGSTLKKLYSNSANTVVKIKNALLQLLSQNKLTDISITNLVKIKVCWAFIFYRFKNHLCGFRRHIQLSHFKSCCFNNFG